MILLLFESAFFATHVILLGAATTSQLEIDRQTPAAAAEITEDATGGMTICFVLFLEKPMVFFFACPLLKFCNILEAAGHSADARIPRGHWCCNHHVPGLLHGAMVNIQKET